jgi:hypothetical protein
VQEWDVCTLLAIRARSDDVEEAIGAGVRVWLGKGDLKLCPRGKRVAGSC